MAPLFFTRSVEMEKVTLAYVKNLDEYDQSDKSNNSLVRKTGGSSFTNENVSIPICYNKALEI